RPNPPIAATCSTRLKFDVWAHNPYTAGGPTHKGGSDQASLGDLPAMKAMLDAAVKAGHIESRGPLRFWVTEFSWDSDPPDTCGMKMKLETRWIAEALYRAWQSGVSLFTWFLLRDQPFPSTPWQSGLY